MIKPRLPKNFYLLISAFILAVILRMVAARNLGVSADDVNHAIFVINIFDSEKLVFWGGSTNLWYYIQGVFYSLFGLSQFVSRFAAVLFGSFLVILVYLFTKKISKSEKAALIASAFIAFSPMLIKSTLPEMDVAVSFFTLLSAYFLFSYNEERKTKFVILSAISIGVGIMIKLYAAFFALSFLAFLIYIEVKKEKNLKKSFKKIAIFSVIVMVLCIPTFAHNYLLYQDKGFMDLIFTNTLKIGSEKAAEFYSWGAGWMPHSDYKGFFLGNQRNFDPTPLPGALVVLGFLFRGDPLLFIFSVLGLAYSYRRHREYFWFFMISFVPAFVYLGAQIPMAKHFIWVVVLAVPVAGSSLEKIIEKIPKIKIKHVLIFIILVNLLYLGMPKGVVHSHVYGESSYGKLIDFKNEKISQESLVVVDSRIYRGNIHWGLAGTNYIEASHFFDIANEINKNGGAKNTEVYYVECVIDDCGWGTVAGQEGFNKSMEETTAFFAERAYFKEDFEGANPEKYYLPLIGEKRTDYRIYKIDLALNPAILEVVHQTYNWYLYPIGYDRRYGDIFDDYNVRGFNRIIEMVAWVILYLELILALGAMIYIIWLFLQE